MKASEESKNYIPKDAKFLKSKDPQSSKSNDYISPVYSSEIRYYSSESLKSRFSESEFTQGKAGCFSIKYENFVPISGIGWKTSSYKISLSCEYVSEEIEAKSINNNRNKRSIR